MSHSLFGRTKQGGARETGNGRDEKAGQSILKGLHEALEHHPGKKTGAREHTFSATDVARIRKSVGLSQQQFSDEFEIA